MKKLFVALFITLVSATFVSAQDKAKAVETFNTAAQALNEENYLEALTWFQHALDMATVLGDEGTEIATNCKATIPTLLLKIAKKYANEQNIATAVEYFENAVAVGTEYGDTAVADEAKTLLVTLKTQTAMNKGNELLNAKDFAGAVASYKEVLAVDPANAVALMRMGMALNASGDFDGAVAAFEEAAKNETQAAAAKKQLSRAYLKKAAAALKIKDSKNALVAAQKSIEYEDNANAQKIVGSSASTLKQYKIAAEAFEAYLALSPNAKDKAQVSYQLATAYKGLGNYAKACAYYKEIAGDLKFGEAARFEITNLKCN